MRIIKYILTTFIFIFSLSAFADLTVPVYLTTPDKPGKQVGTVTVQETKYGLLFMPKLCGLPPGPHGFHIHAMPACDHSGMEAGGHLDPDETNKHLGPYDAGHLGDLPVLAVDQKGCATVPVLAPRLKHLSEIKGHALMIHAGSDNYSDQPEKLGGGGARLACGIIK